MLTRVQPLGDLLGANSQHRPSPAEQSLKSNLHRSPIKSQFNIAHNGENLAPAQSPTAKSPLPPALFATLLGKGKENQQDNYQGYHSQHTSPERRPATGHSTIPVQSSPVFSSQNTVATQSDSVFSPPRTQSTQPTQATLSFAPSIQSTGEARRDTGDSFVSAKEAFASKDASNEDVRAKCDEDAMEIDDERPMESHPDAQSSVVRHELGSDCEEAAVHEEIPEFPQPPALSSEGYGISAKTHDIVDLAHGHAHRPEPEMIAGSFETLPMSDHVSSEGAEHDGTVVHHDVDDQMDIDDDVRSPSDGSSPVKPLVRKSSLTFSALPAREPLLAKKSMGNRNSRTSHVDQNKTRGSNLGRFTGGKSLGGTQLPQAEALQDAMEIDDEKPEIRNDESESAKMHNKTSSQRLLERINMLKQQNEQPKRISQNIISSQMSQTQSTTTSQFKAPTQLAGATQSAQPTQVSQPTYPNLPAADPDADDDEEDDWISPIRTVVPAQNAARPVFTKSYSAEVNASPVGYTLPKPISVSNPDLSTVVESTTPAGSPAGKKYMDGPLSASKAKLYSAFRVAKEKLIGSSATSAQVKLDALSSSPLRPRLKGQDSSDDVFSSPQRNEKTAASIFSHLRSPSKESITSGKSKKAAMPGSPVRANGRRTRSSSEREKQKEKDLKEKQRADDRLKEMREKEQSKATAHHQKNKASTTKTPSAMSSQQSIRQAALAASKTPSITQAPPSRPGTTRTNTAASNEPDSADEMPPPPPPKSFLPTTGHKLREPRKIEPKKLTKTSSKEAISKANPKKIMVTLHNNRYGQAPPAASRPAPPPPAPAAATPAVAKPAPAAYKMAPATKPPAPAPTRPASALSSKSGTASKAGTVSAKPAGRVGRPPVQKPVEKPVEKAKAPPAQSRADLAAARPISRMQTIQDANRIHVPPVNPAKPPAKRPFQAEHDEPLQRPAKRPSQQARMNTVTPAHAQFAKGKIPFAESAQAAQPSQPQYQNGEEIKLPEILTDSEDEDSDNEFEQPSWVNTPNLRELLTQQQLVDPEQVFGPIAPLNMEQVFPNKERHKRFRERTSSAFWANDQVTEEERRKDREAKERLYREGAWSYNPSPRPTPRPGL